jgi:energy-coupling factor transporter ATP-binding protein EcfA2
MTKKSWVTFQDRVRDIAQYVFGPSCLPTRIGGVDIDGAITLEDGQAVLIEMTEERNLGKVRNDVVKLVTAKNALFQLGVLTRSYCVIDGPVTEAMKGAGADHFIKVLSITEFSALFFDYNAYRTARLKAPFGSAVNQATGEQDNTDYVKVRYEVEGHKHEVSVSDIARWIQDGKKLVMLGEYGSGKSRCVQEVFKHVISTADEEFCYPLAVDLKRHWGLENGAEIIRRHVSDLGLPMQSTAIRAFNAGSISLLLDGFDELGSQAWSDDAIKIKAIRDSALKGVKDLIQHCKNGVLITGREHYFPNNIELFTALGLDPKSTLIVRSKNKFSDDELLDYFDQRAIDVAIPEWLPKRPLICQTISDLAADELESMFGEEGDEVAFWNHFIKILCARDARIHPTFDPSAIFRLFVHLARVTRNKGANVGPISLGELQDAFEAAVGSRPVEEASTMLLRLPSLGRLSPETNDRQFIDVYILDGLRAKDVIELCSADDQSLNAAFSEFWKNPLEDLGQRIVKSDLKLGPNRVLEIASNAAVENNKVLASDLVASLMRDDANEFDFRGMELDKGDFVRLDFTDKKLKNLTIKSATINEVVLPSPGVTNVQLIDCVTSRVIGVASAAGLPPWIKGLESDNYDSVENIAKIRRAGLSPAHEILIAIIRKTFFQKGSGRKEEALVRGLGRIAAPKLIHQILNRLLSEGILDRFKGNEGWVYRPVRSKAERVTRIKDELKGSTDALWIEIGTYN